MAFDRQKIDPQLITAAVRHKWSDAILDEGFVPVPKRLVRCAGRIFRGDYRISELRVFLAIVDWQRPNQQKLPSLQYLAYVAGITRNRAKESLNRLQKRGLIKIHEESGRLRIDYKPLLQMVIAYTEEDEEGVKAHTRKAKKRKGREQ